MSKKIFRVGFIGLIVAFLGIASIVKAGEEANIIKRTIHLRK